jgi:Flp pilus assembly protein TadB
MIILQLASAGIVGLATYSLLPAIQCRLNNKLATARLFAVRPALEFTNSGLSGFLPRALLVRLEHWLRRAGYFSARAAGHYLLMVMLPVPLCLLADWLLGVPAGRTIWLALLFLSLVNSQITRQIQTRRQLFIKNLYKIYRFLDLQISAGIKVTDAIRGLPESTRDPHVRPCLIRFSGRFELTLDLDQAMAEIRLAFPGADCELLATHLRQCLQTGMAGRSLVRMEELLFSRCFNLMQQDTRRIRSRLLLTAILGIVPGVLLFIYPLFYQAMKAMDSVFGSI